jgi:ATP-dependent RNA helicase DHX57
VLPPGPREYWKQLEAEHKNIPEHQQWEYESDPFAARKAVDARQAKALKAKQEQEEALAGGRKREKPVVNEFTKAPEVKMAQSLRDMTESAVKKAMADLPELDEEDAATIPESEIPSIMQQLAHIGFKVPQSKSAIEFLSTPSPFARNLIKSLSPLEACIEYRQYLLMIRLVAD